MILFSFVGSQCGTILAFPLSGLIADNLVRQYTYQYYYNLLYFKQHIMVYNLSKLKSLLGLINEFTISFSYLLTTSVEIILTLIQIY